MAELCAEVADGPLGLVGFGNVSRSGEGIGRVLLTEFFQQIRPSANDADAVSVRCILLKQGFANAGCGSDDDGFLVHCSLEYIS